MSEPKATVHYAGRDLFVGISPGGHAQVLDTDHERASALADLLRQARHVAADRGAQPRFRQHRLREGRVAARGGQDQLSALELHSRGVAHSSRACCSIPDS